MADDRSYTVAEAAAKLGVTGQRVRQMCKQGELPEAKRKNGRWTIPGRSVRERFAVRPPKPKLDREAALDRADRLIRELAENNGRLKENLEQARRSDTRARGELENVRRELASRERDLRVAGARSERLRQKLDEKNELIAELEKRLESAEQGRMMGGRRPRLRDKAEADGEPRGRGRRP